MIEPRDEVVVKRAVYLGFGDYCEWKFFEHSMHNAW
jgi:hypothetical protein